MWRKWLPWVVLGAVGCQGPRVVPAPATTTTSAAAASTPATALRWSVTVRDGPILDERLCHADGTPLEVAAVGPVDGRARELAEGLRQDGPCVAFSINLDAAGRRFRDRAAAVGAGDGVVVASPDVWLWTTTAPTGGTLTVTTTGAARAAQPVPRLHPADDDTPAFVVEPSTWRFLSAGVFGAIAPRALDVAGARVEVVALPGERHLVDADIDRWIGGAAAAVAMGAGPSGQLPFSRALVVIQPTPGRGVPFGMVSRGGGPQALLLLGERAAIDEVADQWVAVHELSHLLHPPIALEDAWLGEGLATYHQNVLRARAGLIDEAEAWAELRDGFERGQAAAERGPWTISLAEASRRMRAEGRWLQTYWGGAAIVLWLDVALRRCGGGSIDATVAALRSAHGPVDRHRLRAREVVAAAAAAAPACAHIAADVDDFLQRPFPAIGLELLAALGADGPRLDDDAPLAPVRRQIVGHVFVAGGPRAGGQLSGP